MKRWILLAILGWITTITLLHLWLNLRLFDAQGFRVGFLPVT